MARVKARVRVEDATLEADKFKLERLCSDVSELDAQITSNALEAVEKRANALASFEGSAVFIINRSYIY